MDTADQKDYIKYLEKCLEKYSKKERIANKDLDILLESQNEVIANSIHDLKRLFDIDEIRRENEQLRIKENATNEYIQYLLNSSWWKITLPFRALQRKILSRKKYKPIDYSEMPEIEGRTKVIVYARSLNNDLKNQIKNAKHQEGFSKLDIAILNIGNDKAVSQFAHQEHIECVDPALITFNVSSLKTSLTAHAEYIIYISQGAYVTEKNWLQKMVYPISVNYSNSSILYHKNFSKIQEIETGTVFAELKSRITSIGQYACLQLPPNRNKIQFIPPLILDEISAVAKRN